VIFGRVTRVTFDIVGTFLVLLAVAAGILGWRLSVGPISLDPLTPLVERALSASDGSVVVDIDDTVLAWAGWRRTFDIRVRGVHVLGPDGRLMLDVPEMAVSLSARAMLRGLVAPTSLEVIGVQLALTRTADGALRFHTTADTADHASAADAPSPAAGLLAELMAPPDPASSLGYLRSVAVRDARLTITDEASKRVWTARDADLGVFRDEGGLRIEMSGTAELGGKPAALSATGIYRVDDQISNVTVGLVDVGLAQLATLDPALAPMAGIDVSLNGRLALRFDRRLQLAGATFDLSGTAGRLNATAFNLPQDAVLRGVTLRGKLGEGLRSIDMDEARLDLGGPVVTLRGRMSGLEATPRAEGVVSARGVPVDDLRRLWPRGAAENARSWIVEHLSAGQVGEATAEFAARAPSGPTGKWGVEKLSGTLRFTGLTVNYLPPMPAVRGVDGEARFTAERFDISGSGGGIGALRFAAARVALTGLDTDDEHAAIDVTINGPLRDALVLTDSPPLGYLKKIDQTPDNFTGDATVNLALKFPLKKMLRVDDIGVLATAEVKKLTQRRAALGQDVRDGEVRLRVDRDGMDLVGRVVLGPVPAEVEIRRNFSDKAPFIAQTRARGRVASAADRTTLGFDLLPYVDGPVDLTLDYVERAKSGEVSIDARLDDTVLTVAPLEWMKPAGDKAAAMLKIALADNQTTSITDFRIVAGDPAAGGLHAAGRADLEPDGRSFARVNLTALKTGLTDAGVSYARTSDGIAIDISGVSFDAGPFFRDRSRPAADRPSLNLRVDVDRLYFARDRSLGHLRFLGQRGPDRWETAEISAYTGEGIRIGNQVVLALAKSGDRQALEMRAEDAGAFLKALDITPNVVGGRIEANGVTDEKRPGRPLAGKLHVSEFRAVQAPLLARVLSVALLTGIVDSLTGEGIRFTRLDADFAYFDPRLEVTDASAAGPAIGVTAKGVIDVDAETIDLDGTIVPANALNSLPGRIPLIGQLLTGGGGGLFAANYRVTGPLEDAKVSVNPLSTLAPGFLRGLFGIFTGSSPVGPPADSTPESEKEFERQRPVQPPTQPAPTPP
jgi:hypothetical protein